MPRRNVAILLRVFCLYLTNSHAALTLSKDMSQTVSPGEVVVEIDNSGNFSKVCYSIGKMKKNRVEWHDHYCYETGLSTSVIQHATER